MVAHRFEKSGMRVRDPFHLVDRARRAREARWVDAWSWTGSESLDKKMKDESSALPFFSLVALGFAHEQALLLNVHTPAPFFMGKQDMSSSEHMIVLVVDDEP